MVDQAARLVLSVVTLILAVATFGLSGREPGCPDRRFSLQGCEFGFSGREVGRRGGESSLQGRNANHLGIELSLFAREVSQQVRFASTTGYYLSHLWREGCSRFALIADKMSALPALSRAEAVAILAGDDERLDHLGVDEVAVELIELAQPKIVTVKV